MTYIETPKAADVLCGKDKTFGKHPGNMLYRDLIEAKALDYAAAVYKLDKMKLTTEIVATMVTEFGTRFLRPVGIPTNKVGSSTSSTGTGSSNTNENGTLTTITIPITSDGNATTDMIGWEEISLTAARDKTSHALRFCAANAVPSVNRATQQLQSNSNSSSSNMDGSYGTHAQPPPPPPSATLPTSLIQSQLQASLGAKEIVSQDELLQQQKIALQKGMEELVQQKLNQKVNEQKKLEELEQMRQQQQFQQTLPTDTGAAAAAEAATGNMTINGLRKFKKLPTKASLSTVTKPKPKPKLSPTPEWLKPNPNINPTAEWLNSAMTPVKLHRVKVQKSSRKPKMIVPVTTNVLPPPQVQQQLLPLGQPPLQQHNFRSSLTPSQVSPLSSPYIGHEHYQSQQNHYQQQQQQQNPSIPGQQPLSLPNTRTVSTDMIVLAHAAAVVEAAEAEERAAAAKQITTATSGSV